MAAFAPLGLIALNLIPKLIKPALWGMLVVAVITYYASAITGKSLYGVSMSDFLTQIGVCTGSGCDITAANACIFCPYITDLISAIGIAAGAMYSALVNHIWILLILGFGAFAFISAFKLIKSSADKTADLSSVAEQKFEIKDWVDSIWKQAIRVIIVGVFIGAIGSLGMSGPKLVSDITVKPILSLGNYVSMRLADVPDSACAFDETVSEDSESIVSKSAIRPLICMTGLINTIALKGANEGFGAMNLASESGSAILWVLGLIAAGFFAFYGILMFFELLNIVFTVIFFIIFLPLIIASYAYSNVWSLGKNMGSNILNQVAAMAASMMSLTLRMVIFYKIITYSLSSNLGSPMSAILTLIFVSVFYFYLVEGKLKEKFANLKADNFFNFGDNALSALKGGMNFVSKAASNVVGLGTKKAAGAISKGIKK